MNLRDHFLVMVHRILKGVFTGMGCLGFLIYRFNAVFNVSKLKAFLLSVCLFVGGIPFMFITDPMVIVILVWPWVAVYGAVFCFKFCRDTDAAMKARQLAMQPPEPPVIHMTSQGSDRLFVPKPLDRP